MRARQRGSITLEMVLAIPVVFMLIWGGTVLSIAATAKASLQMTAIRAARELAASDAAQRLDKADQLYEYEEFTETYSLPRPKVKMLVVNHGGIILAGACYRVRLDMPALGKPRSPIPEPLQPVVDEFVPQDMISDFNQLTHDTVDTGNTVKDVYLQAEGLWNSVRNFRPATGTKPEFKDHDKRFQSLEQFDAEVKLRCSGRNIVLTERAAFWSEKTEDPPRGSNPDDQQGDDKDQQTPSLALTLDPTAVTIAADAIPINLPKVTATATVVPADARCAITVEYSSGPSQAIGLDRPTISKTADNAVYRWTWNVGGNTSSGDWPVTVTCNNNKTATVQLHVTGRERFRGEGVAECGHTGE